MSLRMFSVHFVNYADGLADSRFGSVVGQSDVHDGSDGRSSADVDDGCAGHRFVWHGNEVPVQMPDSRAAKADVFHVAFVLFESDLITHLKWFVQKNGGGTKEIAQGILRAKAKCQPTDGE